jgi:S-adenosylmethionine synthetase
MIRDRLFASDANRDDEAIAAALLKAFDLRPGAIIERLDLKKPIYFDTAAHGHFGREGFSWQRVGG